MRKDWLRSFAPGGTGLFMSSRSKATARVRFWAQGLQLIGMTTRLSNHIRGVLKTFGLLPGGMRGMPFDRKVEALLLDRSDVALIVRPMLVACGRCASRSLHSTSDPRIGEVKLCVPAAHEHTGHRRALSTCVCKHS